ncbi:MAG: helix-turn-helix domain-containing protein [Oscillospiraceae bacterium]|jgi:transcriptional regulator with XRE-family HTH domain|nr:helix-turn-helix domain-containing protein [Oscillospiraceae bacterium]
MEYNFGDKIKSLRKSRELTQEQLADIIGVSYQAVSKWETNAALPDVTLFPRLARYFGVTTDELLGMSELRDKERIASERARAHELYMSTVGKTMYELDQDETDLIMEEIRAITRNLALEFPHNHELQLEYAADLQGNGEPREALAVIKRVLDSSTDSSIRASAAIQLIHVYSRLGEHENAAAQIASLPDVYHCREYAQLLFGNVSGASTRDDIARLRGIAVKFSQLTNETLQKLESLERLLQIPHEPESLLRLMLAEQSWRLALLWLNDGLGSGREPNDDRNHPEIIASQLADTQIQIAALLAAEDAERALDYIERVADTACDPALPPLMVTTFIPEERTNRALPVPLGAHIISTRVLEKPAFDQIRNHPRFLAATARLQNA